MKQGEEPGDPRLQGATRSGRFTATQFTATQVGHGATRATGFRVRSTIGRRAVRWSRPVAGTVKTVTLPPAAGGWSCCCSWADVPPPALLPPGQGTGSDVGLTVVLLLAPGDLLETPRSSRRAERELKKAHRHLSRRKTGSTGRKQAVQLRGRKHHKGRRQRTDFPPKTALLRVEHSATRSLEDRRVAHLVQHAPLAKRIGAAGGAQLRTLRAGTAAYAGRRVGAVPPASSSQDCSGGGARGHQRVSVRTHACTSCGLILDRDEHAASNIQAAGQVVQGAATLVAVMN